ncbi:MAG: hypothetical protein Q7J32_06500 [Sphingomonadaceae bacterium]|nr:hypothetical protein [Sphingomonadaceae bacterium]
MPLLGLFLVLTPVMAVLSAAYYYFLRLGQPNPPAFLFVGLAWASCVVGHQVIDGWNGIESLSITAFIFLAPAAVILGFVLLRRREIGALS